MQSGTASGIVVCMTTTTTFGPTTTIAFEDIATGDFLVQVDPSGRNRGVGVNAIVERTGNRVHVAALGATLTIQGGRTVQVRRIAR